MTYRFWLLSTGLAVTTSACSSGGSSESAAQVNVPDGGLCTSCGACEEALSITGATHVPGEVRYADAPPASGDHNACWAEWGVHDEPVADDHWVHNLEHGGVVYLYNCGAGCDTQVKQLAEFVDGRAQALLTPYPALPTKFAVVAWGVRLVSDCYDARVFEAFYTAHVDRGPESVTAGPPGSCH